MDKSAPGEFKCQLSSIQATDILILLNTLELNNYSQIRTGCYHCQQYLFDMH